MAGLAGAVVVGWPLVDGARDAEAAAARRRPPRPRPRGSRIPPSKLAELAGAGRPVFVDFTAAWCVTCQVNKRLVLNTADVRAAFAQRTTWRCVRADWTRRDPGDHRCARRARAQRRARLRALSARQGAARAARGAAEGHRDRRAGDALAARPSTRSQIERARYFAPPATSRARRMRSSVGGMRAQVPQQRIVRLAAAASSANRRMTSAKHAATRHAAPEMGEASSSASASKARE